MIPLVFLALGRRAISATRECNFSEQNYATGFHDLFTLDLASHYWERPKCKVSVLTYGKVAENGALGGFRASRQMPSTWLEVLASDFSAFPNFETHIVGDS